MIEEIGEIKFIEECNTGFGLLNNTIGGKDQLMTQIIFPMCHYCHNDADYEIIIDNHTFDVCENHVYLNKCKIADMECDFCNNKADFIFCAGELVEICKNHINIKKFYGINTCYKTYMK